jgi:hypothetical protein
VATTFATSVQSPRPLLPPQAATTAEDTKEDRAEAGRASLGPPEHDPRDRME